MDPVSLSLTVFKTLVFLLDDLLDVQGRFAAAKNKFKDEVNKIIIAKNAIEIALESIKSHGITTIESISLDTKKLKETVKTGKDFMERINNSNKFDRFFWKGTYENDYKKLIEELCLQAFTVSTALQAHILHTVKETKNQVDQIKTTVHETKEQGDELRNIAENIKIQSNGIMNTITHGIVDLQEKSEEIAKNMKKQTNEIMSTVKKDMETLREEQNEQIKASQFEIAKNMKKQTGEIMSTVKKDMETLREEQKEQIKASQFETTNTTKDHTDGVLNAVDLHTKNLLDAVLLPVNKKAKKESDNGRYKPRGAVTLGSLHLALGLASMTCGIAVYVLTGTGSAATVIALSLFYLLTGVYGIFSAFKRRKTDMIMFFMVMSIVSSISAAVQTFLQFRIVYLWYCCDEYMESPAVIYSNVFGAVFGLLEFITAVISASLCCKGTIACKCCWSCCVCCCGPPAVKRIALAKRDNVNLQKRFPGLTTDNPAYLCEDESDVNRGEQPLDVEYGNTHIVEWTSDFLRYQTASIS